MHTKVGHSLNPNMIINDRKEAKKFSQRIKIKRVLYELYYQDPKLQMIDEYAAKKLIQEVNLDIDREEAMQTEKYFFEGKVSITDDTIDEKKTKDSKAKKKKERVENLKGK